MQVHRTKLWISINFPQTMFVCFFPKGSEQDVHSLILVMKVLPHPKYDYGPGMQTHQAHTSSQFFVPGIQPICFHINRLATKVTAICHVFPQVNSPTHKSISPTRPQHATQMFPEFAIRGMQQGMPRKPDHIAKKTQIFWHFTLLLYSQCSHSCSMLYLYRIIIYIYICI